MMAHKLSISNCFVPLKKKKNHASGNQRLKILMLNLGK